MRNLEGLWLGLGIGVALLLIVACIVCATTGSPCSSFFSAKRDHDDDLHSAGSLQAHTYMPPSLSAPEMAEDAESSYVSESVARSGKHDTPAGYRYETAQHATQATQTDTDGSQYASACAPSSEETALLGGGQPNERGASPDPRELMRAETADPEMGEASTKANNQISEQVVPSQEVPADWTASTTAPEGGGASGDAPVAAETKSTVKEADDAAADTVTGLPGRLRPKGGEGGLDEDEDTWYLHRRRGTTYEGSKQGDAPPGGEHSTARAAQEAASKELVGQPPVFGANPEPQGAAAAGGAAAQGKKRNVSVTPRRASRSATEGAALADSAAATADAKVATKHASVAREAAVTAQQMAKKG